MQGINPNRIVEPKIETLEPRRMLSADAMEIVYFQDLNHAEPVVLRDARMASWGFPGPSIDLPTRNILDAEHEQAGHTRLEWGNHTYWVHPNEWTVSFNDPYLLPPEMWVEGWLPPDRVAQMRQLGIEFEVVSTDSSGDARRDTVTFRVAEGTDIAALEQTLRQIGEFSFFSPHVAHDYDLPASQEAQRVHRAAREAWETERHLHDGHELIEWDGREVWVVPNQWLVSFEQPIPLFPEDDVGPLPDYAAMLEGMGIEIVRNEGWVNPDYRQSYTIKLSPGTDIHALRDQLAALQGFKSFAPNSVGYLYTNGILSGDQPVDSTDSDGADPAMPLPAESLPGNPIWSTQTLTNDLLEDDADASLILTASDQPLWE